ncbi:PAS domain S-box protein [Neptuniibacter sp.]|uniref:PAS domain S-box protein n=1 Tax=Neptuniibacter sp. TaxID=1962643 RepID=UPI002613EEF6|nr:PAS domain S-box protein [Neptuniibacter sp.]MCP4596720.1 PAS domain S-box protein [Neptuniibacter sp.]
MNLSVIELDTAPLKTILTPNVVTVSPDCDLSCVLSLMQSRAISSVVAINEMEKPVGIFTEQDAIRLMADGRAVSGLLMQDVMSHPVLTVQSSIGYGKAYQLMSENRVRHLLVVDEEGRLAGLVSEGDFLHHMGMEYLVELKTVESSMTSNVQTVATDMKLLKALQIMSSVRISCVVVVEEGKPVGVLTERDMVRLARRDVDISNIPIKDEMTSPLLTVESHAPLQVASRMMEQHKIRRLVVVGEKGQLKGILTRHDIAKSLQGSYIEYLQESLERKNRDLQHTEERLREVEQKAFYQDLVEQISDAIFIIDADDARVLEANDQASTSLHISRSELLNLRVSDFLKSIKTLEDWFDEFIPELRKKDELLIETFHQRSDGTEYPVEIKARLVNFGLKEYVVAVARDLSEREEATRKIKESERRFEALFENAPLAYQSLDMNGNLRAVNNAWLEMLGCERKEVIGKHITAFLMSSSLGTLNNEFPRFVNKGRVDGPLFELKTKTGERCIVRVNGQLGKDPVSGEVCTHCMLTNVTQQEKAAESIRESEQRFRLLFEQSSLAMAYVSYSGELISLNQEFVNVFGYDETELSGLENWLLLVHPNKEYRDQVRERWLASVENARQGDSKIEPQEYLVRCKNGEIKTVRASGMVTDQGFLAVLDDITEQRQAAEALKESAETYFGVITTALDGFWIVDTDGSILDVNEAYVKMSGFSREELMGMKINDLDVVESPADTRERIESIMNSRGALFTTKHRRKDGNIYDVEVNATYWAGGGSGGHFFAFLRDITQKRLDEEKLRQAATVFGSTNDGVMITGTDGVIQMVNEAFCHLTGYSEAEIIGAPARILQSGRHDNQFYQEMWKSISETGSWQGEIWNRRKDGSTYPELLSINAVYDDAGEISNYVGVFADISRLKESEQKLAYLAHHDMLTGLPNRLMLHARLEQAMGASKRNASYVALLLLDLDRFKDVNDSFGHAAGDELLQQIADLLQKRLRQVDIVCRMGGDEFAVLLEDIHHPEDAGVIADEIISLLAKAWTLSNGCEVAIGASVGISLYPTQSEDADALLQHADAALYRAKAEGRGRFHYFTEELTQDARNRLDLEAKLIHGIENQEFEVYYQPQVDIDSGCIVGAEALVRWNDPDKGIVSPLDFIPLAEQTGLISDIGRIVLRTACAQVSTWIDQGYEPISIAVNLSAVQLRHLDIKSEISSVLAETKLPASYLELEITESALMEREQESIELLHSLRELGVKIAIDDFGTGYSSLAYLKKFPLDVLKIDKSFVDDIPSDKDDMVIASTIVAMGHSLGLKVLAEGVETAEQLEFLRSKTCNSYQGFLTSPPVPADIFERYLQEK